MEGHSSDFNDKRDLQYFVANQTTVLIRIVGTCDVNVNTLHLGMLVEALEDLKDNALRIRVTDRDGSKTWCGTEWRCHKYNLIPVSQKIWQYLLAVPSPQDRVKLANNEVLCKQISNISVNDRVWYLPDCNKYIKELALVRYIGSLPQLGTGHYLDLELLDTQEDSKTSLLIKECSTSTYKKTVIAIITNILPYKTETDTTSNNIEKTLFLKSNTASGYVNDKKKSSMFDSIPAILLEKFNTFDDNKNINRESVNMLKEQNRVIKPNIENDVNIPPTNIDHSFLNCGNSIIINAIDKIYPRLLSLRILG